VAESAESSLTHLGVHSGVAWWMSVGSSEPPAKWLVVGSRRRWRRRGRRSC